MTNSPLLSRLLEAERAQRRPTVSVEKGWAELKHAVETHAPAQQVGHGLLRLGLSSTTKWLAQVGVIALATAGSLSLLPRRSAPSAPVGPSAPSAVPRAVVVEAVPTPQPSAEPEKPEPGTTSVSASPPAPSSSDQSSTFSEELRVIKAAKRELDAGKGNLAEVWLNEHAQRFPHGVFSGEREALRVVVGCLDSPAAGRAKAARFLGQNPDSPMVDRISHACGLGEGAAAAAPLPTSSAFPGIPDEAIGK